MAVIGLFQKIAKKDITKPKDVAMSKKISGACDTTTITIEKNGRKHEIYCEFTMTVENDGIGDYEYWGFKGYDAGVDYFVLDEIEYCELVRTGRVENEADIPSWADDYEVYKDKDGKTYYVWEHRREIEPNQEILSKIDKYVGTLCVDDYVPEPDYDDEDKDYYDPAWDMPGGRNW